MLKIEIERMKWRMIDGIEEFFSEMLLKKV